MSEEQLKYVEEATCSKEQSKNRALAEKYRRMVQIGATVGLILTVLIGFWIVFGSYFKPEHEGGLFSKHLRDLGIFGPILFMIIQVIQVVLPIIPGGAVSVSGNFVFGPYMGFVYNYIGIFIGSMIAFHLARRYGEFFVKCFISDETYDKYIGWTYEGNKFAWLLGILFFLPAAPDDVLCMIAGLTKMKFRNFVLIFIPTKAVSTFAFTWIMQEGILYVINDLWPSVLKFFGM